jgi:hypothetical protein
MADIPQNTSYAPETVRARAVSKIKPLNLSRSKTPSAQDKYKNIERTVTSAAPMTNTSVGLPVPKTVRDINIQQNYPGYQFTQRGSDDKVRFDPSPTARFATLNSSIGVSDLKGRPIGDTSGDPQLLGGGQFAYDTQDPNIIYQSPRRWETPAQKAEKAELLGGKSPSLFQVDHILPIWIGGTDEKVNKQVLALPDHEQKTKVNEVVRAMYNRDDPKNSLISKAEAINYLLNWNDKNVRDVVLPEVKYNKDGSSYMPLLPKEYAAQKLKEWRSVAPITTSDYKESFKETAKSFTTGLGKAIDKLPLPPAVSATIKGFWTGFMPFKSTLGIEPTERVVSPHEAEWEKKMNDTLVGVGNFVGETAGGIAQFVFAEGLIVGALSKLASGASAGFKLDRLGKIAAGVDKNALAAKEALTSMPAAKAAAASAAEAGNNSTRLLDIFSAARGPVLAPVLKALKGEERITPALVKIMPTLGSAVLKNTVVFNAVGQLNGPGPEGDRMRQVFTDTAMAVAFAGIQIKGTKYGEDAGKSALDSLWRNKAGIFLAGFAGAGIEYMNSGDADAALMSGAVLAGLHGMGTAGNFKTARTVGLEGEKMMTKLVNDHRAYLLEKTQLGEGLIPMPAPLKANATQTEKMNKAIEMNKFRAETTEQNHRLADGLAKLVDEGKITPEVYDKNMAQLVFNTQGWTDLLTKTNSVLPELRATTAEIIAKEKYSELNRNNGFELQTFKDRTLPSAAADVVVAAPGVLKITPELPPGLPTRATHPQFFAWAEKKVKNLVGRDATPKVNEAGEPVSSERMPMTGNSIKDESGKYVKSPIDEVNRKLKIIVDQNNAKGDVTHGILVTDPSRSVWDENAVTLVVNINGKLAVAGYYPRAENIANNMNKAVRENSQATGRQISLYDEKMDNRAFSNNMKENGLKFRIVEVENVYLGQKSGIHQTIVKFGVDRAGTDMDILSHAVNTVIKPKQHWSLQALRKMQGDTMESYPRAVNKGIIADKKSAQPPKEKGMVKLAKDKEKVLNQTAQNIAKVSQTKAKNPVVKTPTVKQQLPPEDAARAKTEAEALAMFGDSPTIKPEEQRTQPEMPFKSPNEAFNEAEQVKNKIYEEKKTIFVKEQPEGVQTPSENLVRNNETGQVVPQDKPVTERKTSMFETQKVSGSEFAVPEKQAVELQSKMSEASSKNDSAGVAVNIEAAKELDVNGNLERLAKESASNSKDPGAISSGWMKFMSSFKDILKKYNLTTNFKKEESMDLKRRYNKMANSEVIYTIDLNKGVVVPKGKDNTGKAQKMTAEFNKTHGLPEDEMMIFKSDLPKGGDTVDRYGSMLSKVDNITDQNGKKIKVIPINKGQSGDETIDLVKFSQKPVDLVMAEEQAIAAGKLTAKESRFINEGETFTSDVDRFIRGYIVDVLKLEKSITDADFVKREPLLFNRYSSYIGPDSNKNIGIHILQSPLIGKTKAAVTPEFLVKEFGMSSEEAVKAAASLNKMSWIDGKFFVGEKLFNQLRDVFGYYETHSNSLKPIISGDVKINDKAISLFMKGHIIKADKLSRAVLKEEFGVNLGDWEVAAFDTNVKLGKGAPSKIELPLSSFYDKNVAYDNVGNLTATTQRKFSFSDIGVKEDLISITKKQVDLLNTIIKEINSSPAEKLPEVLEKYKDYGFSPDSMLWGELMTTLSRGGGKKSFRNEIAKAAKGFLRDYILNTPMENSGRAFMSPAVKMKFPDGEIRFPKNDELVIGKELMQRLGVKEGERVFVSRDPSPDITNVRIMKVVDGSGAGHTSLGTENAIVSPLNERLVFRGDTDGDNVLIARVGEGGITENMAAAIEKRSKGMIFVEEAAKPTNPKFVTEKGLNAVMNKQIFGDSMKGFINAVNRKMDTIVENKITIKLDAASREYTLFSNGKEIERGKLKKPIDKSVTFTPVWDDAAKQKVNQVIQYALDSKGSESIVEITGGDTSWALKYLFKPSTEVGGKEIGQLNNALKVIDIPFNKATKISDEGFRGLSSVLTGDYASQAETSLKRSADLTKKIKEVGGKTTPLQDKIEFIVDKLDNVKTDKGDIVDSDVFASKELRKQFGDLGKNDKLNEIRKFVMPKKARHSEIVGLEKNASIEDKAKYKEEKAKIIEEIRGFYNENLPSYTPEDIKNISYWAAVSPELNFGHTLGHYDSKPNFVYRLNDIINKDIEVSKAYYKAFESDLVDVVPPKVTYKYAEPPKPPTAPPVTKSPVRKNIEKAVAENKKPVVKNTGSKTVDVIKNQKKLPI